MDNGVAIVVLVANGVLLGVGVSSIVSLTIQYINQIFLRVVETPVKHNGKQKVPPILASFIDSSPESNILVGLSIGFLSVFLISLVGAALTPIGGDFSYCVLSRPEIMWMSFLLGSVPNFLQMNSMNFTEGDTLFFFCFLIGYVLARNVLSCGGSSKN